MPEQRRAEDDGDVERGHLRRVAVLRQLVQKLKKIGRNATLAADTICLVCLYIYHSVRQFVLLQNITTLSECFNLNHHVSVYLSL